MSIQTNLNVTPYFDDYDPSKRFHRILFKAGQTVQARELSQVQDILNDQVESIGSHLFKNGSSVIQGDFTVKTKLKSLNFTITSGSLPSSIDNDKPITIVGLTSNVEATITKLNVNNCFIEVVKSGLEGESNSFSSGEVLVFSSLVNGVETELARATETAQGLGSYARVEDGIYYIRGIFVRVEAQEIIIDEISNPSSQIGFNVTEEIISSNEDGTLNSNAIGFPNYRASGADRLKITLSLEKRDLGVEEPDFIRLALINIGEIEDVSNQVEYSELEKVLAQRTYEESGNYSVSDFDFEIREHLNDGINGGVYTEEEGGDDAKLVAVIEPGIHYVFGFRIENDTERLITFPKSRETDVANNSVTPAQYGSLVQVENCSGVPIIANNIEYELRNNVDDIIATMKVFSSIKISDNTYQLVSRNIEFVSGNSWSQVVSITSSLGSASFTGTPSIKGLVEGTDESLIFKLPYSGVRTLESTGTTDTNYSTTRSYNFLLNSEGKAVVSAPFGSQFIGSYSLFSVSLEDGSAGEIPVQYTLVGSPLGSSIEIDAGVGYGNNRVSAVLINQKNVSVPRSKTLTVNIQTINVSSSVSRYTLEVVDAVEIKSLRIDGVDYKSSFNLLPNQTDSTYELSQVEAIGSIPSGQMTIEYTYFQHGAGDYFCIDSYNGIEYDDIQGYTSKDGTFYDLRDSLDFRRSVGQTTDNGSIVSPRSNLQSDIEYYLPRFVALYVDSSGDFGATIGVSSNSVDKSNIPTNAMRLADLYVPSWTPNAESVLAYPIDNKRFTMRDIGNIEKRVSNIEYTTSLNLLETSASNIQVIDPISGSDRFKNGIFADPFLDFRLMDTELSEASIDDTNGGRLRPQVSTIGINMEYFSGGSEKANMVTTTVSTPSVVFTSQPFATRSINVNPHASFSWAGFVELTPSTDFWFDTVYKPTKVINQTLNLRGGETPGVTFGQWSRTNNGRFTFGVTQARTNTTTVFNEWTTTRSAGESILSTQLIPFMRAITIRFKASGMRPFTRVYPWFGNREVSQYCRPITGGAFGTSLVTDESGNFDGEMFLPNNNGFASGEKSFILVDNKTDPNKPLERTTIATASFASGGTLVTKQRKTIQTRVLGVTKRRAVEFRRVDPIAQSFAIETSGGLFCSGVDIFMKTKSNTIPLTVEIREMENGIPTHDVLARTVVNPSDVRVSSNSATATRVSFAPSIYLREGSEYCIVLLANTQEYQAFISEMGETVINSVKTLASQPHTGVFFTSANGSTWTPSQTQDLKFSLLRDSYSTNVVSSIFRPKVTDFSVKLGSNPLSSVGGSNVLGIEYHGHGCKVGDTITLSGILPNSGLTSSSLNRVHIVTEVVDFDNIKVTLSDQAQQTRDFGGSEVIASGGVIVNLLNININYTDFDTSKVKFEFRYRLQNSRTMSSWLQFTPSSDVLLPEDGSYRATGDLEVRATFDSSTNLLSPQVDEFGFCATLTSFRLSPTQELFNYVSKPISLENPSTSGKFFIGALLSGGSNMKLYIKPEGNEIWEEVSPDNPIVNSTSEFSETAYSLGEKDPFATFRIKVSLTGSRSNPPILRDIRGIVLA